MNCSPIFARANRASFRSSFKPTTSDDRRELGHFTY